MQLKVEHIDRNFVHTSAENRPIDNQFIDDSLKYLPIINGYPLNFSVAQGEPIEFLVARNRCADSEIDSAFYRIERYIIRDWISGKIVQQCKLDHTFLIPYQEPKYYYGYGACYTTKVTLPTTNLEPSIYEFIIIDEKGNKSCGLNFNLKHLEEQRKQAKLVCLLPLFTWQAYNKAGGGSFYSTKIGEPRSISLLRPLHLSGVNSLSSCLHILGFFHNSGISFCTIDSLELHHKPIPSSQANILCVLAHDEYWSEPMLEHLKMFLHQGGKMLVLSGNTCYWRVRVQENDIVCRKRGNPLDFWCLPHINKPEESIFGLSWRFGGYPIHRETKFVQGFFPHHWSDSQKYNARGITIIKQEHKIFDGLDIKDGNVIGAEIDLISVEVDGILLDKNKNVDYSVCNYAPKNLEVLATTPLVGAHDKLEGLRTVGVLTEHKVGSGKVIHLGSIGWYSALAKNHALCQKMVLNAINYLEENQDNQENIIEDCENMTKEDYTFNNLLFTRKELTTDKVWSVWNKRYAENKSHFGLHQGGLAFLQETTKIYFNNKQPLNFFELGCGQGYIMEAFLPFFRSLIPEEIFQSSRFVGLDASESAILQCCARMPSAFWISDELQKFIHSPLAHFMFGSFDFVFSLGGITFLRHEDELIDCCQGINKLLKPGGIFAYTISRSYYENVWSPRTDSSWNRKFFEICEDAIGKKIEFEDKSLINVIFIKK